MPVVAAVRALWLCGNERRPFDFATDSDSADSENKATSVVSFESRERSGGRLSFGRLASYDDD